MHTPSVCGRPNPSHGARAFTLVELVTAASIMTIIMIGVVEIFTVVTQTAAEAEAIHGAYQQMRATLDRLNRDLRGITREGPLQISTALPTGGDSEYRSDALAFVSVGKHFGTYNQTCRAGAAEVLYTTNVETPPDLDTAGYFLKINKVGDKNEPDEDQNLDYRRGVLARSTWLMSGTDDSPSLPLEQKDTFKFAWLGQLFGSADNALPVGPTKVVPFLPGSGDPPNPTVRRVMTTGTSEFSVEYGDGTNWQHNTKTFKPGDSDWPKAIRVTLAVHDPDDRGPLPAGKNRYEGYALQETFWLGNP
jgi:type II secretory pathway pseudopilin PulG